MIPKTLILLTIAAPAVILADGSCDLICKPISEAVFKCISNEMNAAPRPVKRLAKRALATSEEFVPQDPYVPQAEATKFRNRDSDFSSNDARFGSSSGRMTRSQSALYAPQIGNSGREYNSDAMNIQGSKDILRASPYTGLSPVDGEPSNFIGFDDVPREPVKASRGFSYEGEPVDYEGMKDSPYAPHKAQSGRSRYDGEPFGLHGFDPAPQAPQPPHQSYFEGVTPQLTGFDEAPGAPIMAHNLHSYNSHPVQFGQRDYSIGGSAPGAPLKRPYDGDKFKSDTVPFKGFSGTHAKDAERMDGELIDTSDKALARASNLQAASLVASEDNSVPTDVWKKCFCSSAFLTAPTFVQCMDCAYDRTGSQKKTALQDTCANKDLSSFLSVVDKQFPDTDKFDFTGANSSFIVGDKSGASNVVISFGVAGSIILTGLSFIYNV